MYIYSKVDNLYFGFWQQNFYGVTREPYWKLPSLLGFPNCLRYKREKNREPYLLNNPRIWCILYLLIFIVIFFIFRNTNLKMISWSQLPYQHYTLRIFISRRFFQFSLVASIRIYCFNRIRNPTLLRRVFTISSPCCPKQWWTEPR